MTIVSILTQLSALDIQPWLLGAAAVLRLAAAGIGFAVAIHRGVRYFRSRSK
jgi:hypothetical protein